VDTNDTIWTIVIVCFVALYLWAVLVAIWYLWDTRKDCFTCAYRQAWIRSCLFAFLMTPSLIGNFWLFAFPGPAALGFAIMLPGVFFASGHRMELMMIISVLYVLPWAVCTAVIFYLWRFIRWRRAGRGRT
jgi:hypothetical protein